MTVKILRVEKRLYISAKNNNTWWRHQMKTFCALLALCAGNSPVTGEFPTQRPVTRSFDVFFICAWINGWVNNHEAGDLRRHRAHYDVIVMNSTSIIQTAFSMRCLATSRIKIYDKAWGWDVYVFLKLELTFHSQIYSPHLLKIDGKMTSVVCGNSRVYFQFTYVKPATLQFNNLTIILVCKQQAQFFENRYLMVVFSFVLEAIDFPGKKREYVSVSKIARIKLQPSLQLLLNLMWS